MDWTGQRHGTEGLEVCEPSGFPSLLLMEKERAFQKRSSEKIRKTWQLEEDKGR